MATAQAGPAPGWGRGGPFPHTPAPAPLSTHFSTWAKGAGCVGGAPGTAPLQGCACVDVYGPARKHGDVKPPPTCWSSPSGGCWLFAVGCLLFDICLCPSPSSAALTPCQCARGCFPLGPALPKGFCSTKGKRKQGFLCLIPDSRQFAAQASSFGTSRCTAICGLL